MITNEKKRRLTITEVAQIVGISAKTIVRWEKMGKIKKPKRDWRSWRVYDENDLMQIRELHDILVEVE
jgi:DNA-binding transcriptional MerR regulator